MLAVSILLVACTGKPKNGQNEPASEKVPLVDKVTNTDRNSFFLKGNVKTLKFSYNYSTLFIAEDDEQIYKTVKDASIGFDQEGNITTLAWADKSYPFKNDNMSLIYSTDTCHRIKEITTSLYTDILPLFNANYIRHIYSYDTNISELPERVYTGITYGGEELINTYYIRYSNIDTHGNWRKAEYTDTRTAKFVYTEIREISYY